MPRIIKIPSDTGVSSNSTYQTPITATSTTFDGTQEGADKVYVFESATDQTLDFSDAAYPKDKEIYFDVWGDGVLELLATTNVRLRGNYDIDGKFLFDGMGALKSRGVIGGKTIFTVSGSIGGSGVAVNSTVYNTTGLLVGATQNIPVGGDGFAENMLVTLTGNATLNSWAFISRQSITLNVTATGAADDTITVDYDNGKTTTDTAAITIVSQVYLMDEYPFPYGWSYRQLSGSTTYTTRLRRSSDDQKLDIEPDTNGETSLTSLTSLSGDVATWVGAGNANVVTLYNQGTTGTSYDVRQSTDANQPLLIDTGAMVTAGGTVWAEYDGSATSLATTNAVAWVDGDYSFFTTVRFNDLTNQQIISADSGALFWLRLRAAGDTIQFNTYDDTTVITTDTSAVSINTNYQISVFKNGTDIEIFVNGVSETTLTAPAIDKIVSELLYMGLNESGTHPLNGYLSSIVIYDTDQRANRAAIETYLNPTA